MAEEYLDKLNDQQREAVAYCDGPQLVIAGAGSGKTRVLTYKIVHLLYHGYEPWRILALTFTNKAAREMRERIEQLTGPDTSSKLWMGTFHSIFARILRQNAELIGFKSSFTIYDASDSKSLVKSIVKDMQLDEKVYKPSTVLGSISWAKNALVSPEAYAADRELMEADRRARRPLTAEIYRAYRDRCIVAGAMDFDDLLYYMNLLLVEHPDVRRHYREFFRYILVDEYQDTNHAQHRIVTLMTGDEQKLCVVGDDA
ncbi:MAG: UvrD-helicase domain-containing protein, partial [Duncaniella sp.]|nr:UvrD-helicase domain-containing protein [Duncaniella sp.]